MQDLINNLKAKFPNVTEASFRNREGKAYLTIKSDGYSTCSAIGMWLRDEWDKDAYMTSGGAGGGTFRLPKFSVVKKTPKTETVAEVTDRYGRSIQVLSRVAFNHCGDVALGQVESITVNKAPASAIRNWGSQEAWAKRSNRGFTFHVRHFQSKTISKVVNSGGIVVI